MVERRSTGEVKLTIVTRAMQQTCLQWWTKKERRSWRQQGRNKNTGSHKNKNENENDSSGSRKSENKNDNSSNNKDNKRTYLLQMLMV